MKKRPTQSDIAKIVGESQRAVASVVGTGNPSSGVSAKTRERILEVAQKLGYRPHRGAQLMGGARSGLIGCIKSNAMSEKEAMKGRALDAAVRAEGYQLISLDICWSDRDLEQALYFLDDIGVEGLFLSHMAVSHHHVPLFHCFRSAGVPVVSTKQLGSIPEKGMHAVDGDTEQGMSLLMDHLMQQGLTRVAYVFHRDTPDTLACSRHRTYAETMCAAGLDPDWIPVDRMYQGDCLGEALDMGRRGMESVLARDQWPEAVCFQNDIYALGGMALCRDRKIDVPGAIAIAGFDNHSLGAYSSPSLTSVSVQPEEIAQAACDLLMGLLRGDIDGSVSHVKLVPCELVVRASTQRIPGTTADAIEESEGQEAVQTGVT